MISEESGFALEETTIDMLGRAKSVKITKEDTIILGGSGDHTAVESRLTQISNAIRDAVSDFDREKQAERLAMLTYTPR